MVLGECVGFIRVRCGGSGWCDEHSEKSASPAVAYSAVKLLAATTLGARDSWSPRGLCQHWVRDILRQVLRATLRSVLVSTKCLSPNGLSKVGSSGEC